MLFYIFPYYILLFNILFFLKLLQVLQVLLLILLFYFLNLLFRLHDTKYLKLLLIFLNQVLCISFLDLQVKIFHIF